MTIARIGRFGVERVLGTGSFATVWLARDEDLDAWVAIKLLAENWSLNEDARRRFLEEARALRRLDDDRIVRVYEISRLSDDRPYIVMEYADRGTLEDRMRLRAQLDQPFSLREAKEISVEIAECLIAVHGVRMVHRDVKPSNVLFRSLGPERQEALRRNGQPVVKERTLLGDFGIARRLEGVLGHTMVLGSPHYMAPEQADPERARLVDYRSDIYSAAVILHELLTGRLPGLEEVRLDGSPALEEVLRKGLSPQPSDRFDSAWEWRDALRAAPLDDVVRVRDVATATVSAGGSGTMAPALGRPVRPTRPGTTLSAPTQAGTKVLESPVTYRPAPKPVRTVDVRMPAAWAMVSALAVFVGSLVPWSAGPSRLGIDFAESAVAISAAALLLLSGVRMWRTRRRWVAATAATVASISGLSAAAVGLYSIFRIALRDRNSLGPGPEIVLVGALVAFVAGARALKRLRRVERPSFTPG